MGRTTRGHLVDRDGWAGPDATTLAPLPVPPDRSKRTGLPAGTGVTPGEAALFSVMHYGSRTPEYIPRSAASPDHSPCGPLPVEECQDALADCLRKGWLQVIDDDALRRIATELREENVIGPVYGMPPTGDVDFTPVGAAMWQRLRAILYAEGRRTAFTFCDVVRCRSARFFPGRAAALAEIEQDPETWDHVDVAGPEAIGPWRVRWWHRFPEGYRVEVEWRSPWKGRCGDPDSWFLPRSTLWREDPDRRQRVLAAHGLDLARWLPLAKVADDTSNYPSRLAGIASVSSDRHFGAEVTLDECKAGLDASLANGWLRHVDAKAIAEIEDVLRGDPATMPLTRGVVPVLGVIDFTQAGADLYHSIVEDFLGPGWADGLSAQRHLYSEEHRYGETEQDILAALAGCASRDKEVTASRVVPIGPWCARWWERFPRGYRLELEFGSQDRGVS